MAVCSKASLMDTYRFVQRHHLCVLVCFLLFILAVSLVII